MIQKIGTMGRMTARGKGRSAVIRHDAWDTPLALGESVSVNGACLTVASSKAGEFACDVLEETLKKTSLGSKRAGALLNLERALRADERLGGHIVSGHVDGVGTVASVARPGEDWVLEIGCDALLLSGMVPKGSIAVDGASLTIAELRERTFTVHLIPHTWSNTALRTLKKNDSVNLETDIVGKYVQRYLATAGATGKNGLTLDRILKAGFGG